MDGSSALQHANAGFHKRLRRIEPHDWERPTPCIEWDVRALVNHVIGGNRRYVMLLRGATAADVQRTRAEDHLGADAAASFSSTATQLVSAFLEDGAESRIAHHPIGDRTGAELLAMRVIDVTVHTWDLARAIRADEALHEAAVEFALAHIDVISAARDHRSYAMPTTDVSDDDRPQSRLLRLAGRSPKEHRS